MQKLKVSIAQIPVNDKDIFENVKMIESAIDKAIEQGADILLTPEGSLSGYHSKFNQCHVEDGLKKLVRRASDGNLGLALGTCYIEDDKRCYNQLRFYEKDGRFLGYHSKTLVCGSLEFPSKGEIEEYSVKPLCTFQFQNITIGGLICNDMWANPGCTPQDDVHLARTLKEMGAKVIFHAVNGGRDTSEFSQVVIRNYHESNLLMRAQGYQVWIATVDNAYPCENPNSCSGGVVNPKGMWELKLDNTGIKQELCEIIL